MTAAEYDRLRYQWERPARLRRARARRRAAARETRAAWHERLRAEVAKMKEAMR